MNEVALAEQAERRRSATMAALDPATQVRLGQYFTPVKAAELLAAMVVPPEGGRFRILDPGAGTGSLTAALVAKLAVSVPSVHLEVTCCEVDPALLSPLRETLSECQRVAESCGAAMSWTIVAGDYISLSTGMEPDKRLEAFDLVLMNPPYRELGAGDSSRRALAETLIDTPNLYAAFMALGVSQLKSGGQLVAITPRSFANGPSFGPFRKYLTDAVGLTRIHDFASRSKVFADGKVLQETIVIAGERGASPTQVVHSTSTGHEDAPLSRIVSATAVVDPDDTQRLIRIPNDDVDVAKVVASPNDLHSLGILVSTGRVVDFRNRLNLSSNAHDTSFPMIYSSNFSHGEIRWPTAHSKPQHYLVHRDVDARRLMPAGSYVVVKRFTSKEERRRVVAAVWSPSVADSPVAFDNKTNVMHKNRAGMDLELACGLSIWLNGTPIDNFFRTFSGHTQVNAADLRFMRYPGERNLRILGSSWSPLLTQDGIDALIAKHVFRVEGF